MKIGERLAPALAFIRLPVAKLEDPGQVESKPDVAAEKFAGSLCYICPFVHSICVAEMKLENMTAGFNVKAKRKGIVITGMKPA